MLLDAAVLAHCAVLATFAAPAIEVKVRSEYGMEQEVNSQIPLLVQNQNQSLAVYLVGVLETRPQKRLKKLFKLLRVKASIYPRLNLRLK